MSEEETTKEEITENKTTHTGDTDEWFSDSQEDDSLVSMGHVPYSEDAEPAKKEDTAKEPSPEQTVNWEKRYKDLQSYHDKQRVQWETERSQMDKISQEYKDLQALRDVIVSKPHIMKMLENELMGDVNQQTYSGVGAPNNLQIPPRPRDYDPMDEDDPSTPSGQWKMQVENIKQQQLIQTINSNIKQQLNIALSEYDKKRQQDELIKKQYEDTKRQFDEFFGSMNIPQDKAERFIRFYKGGPKELGRDRLELKELWEFFNILEGSTNHSQKEVINTEDAISSKIKSSKQNVPVSVTEAAGSGDEQMSEDELFSRYIAKSGLRSKRWVIK